MRRDYGLVEILFEKTAVDWTCVNASLLPHRLASDRDEIVPPGVQNFYGPVNSNVQFSSVASEMNSRRVRCEEIADRDKSHYVRYWVERSEVIIVVQGAEASAPGAVWSIGKANDAEVWRKPYM